MAQMASGRKFASGSITIDATTETVTIDAGIIPKSFSIFVSNKTLTPGIRNLGALYHLQVGQSIYEIGVASNATGSSWGGATLLNVDNTATRYAITISGTQVTINTSLSISNAKFLEGNTYNWFASE